MGFHKFDVQYEFLTEQTHSLKAGHAMDLTFLDFVFFQSFVIAPWPLQFISNDADWPVRVAGLVDCQYCFSLLLYDAFNLSNFNNLISVGRCANYLGFLGLWLFPVDLFTNDDAHFLHSKDFQYFPEAYLKAISK